MKKIWKLIALAIVVLVIAWVLWANSALEVNTVTLQEVNLPEAFDGFCIAHLSDFHSAANMTKSVVEALKAAQPDMICITGDLVDSRSSSVEAALRLTEEAVAIAPCYYITGNHESRLSTELFQTLLSGLQEQGVIVLADEQILLEKNGAQIAVAGHFWGDTDEIGEISDFSGYRILLSHHPEAIDDYAAAGYDLVLAGHAHGGQFRLPFIGGLYAPGQGFLPAYDAGLFTQENTDMVVSRGIGNSIIPLRFNNRPEVVLIELKCSIPANVVR